MHMFTHFHRSWGNVTIIEEIHILWGIGHIFQGTFGLLFQTWTSSTHATLEILEHFSSFTIFGVFSTWFEVWPKHVGSMISMWVFKVMNWHGHWSSLPCGSPFLYLRAWSCLGDYSWWFLEHIMRRESTFEVILHVFLRSCHLEERKFRVFLVWEHTLPCFEASTPLFWWNIVLGENTGPIVCGMFLLHEVFMYMWYHFILYWLCLLIYVDDKSPLIVY